jgi:hypothetical protein
MRGVAVLLLIWLVTPSTSIAAQRDAPFEIGEVLRITAPACGVEEQTARYLRIYRDTLTVQADSVLTLHVADVTLLDVSRGISDKSTLIGIGAGAFAGVLVGIAVASDQGSDMSSSGTPSNNTGTQITNSRSDQGSVTLSGAAVAPIAGAFIGGFVGGLVGKAFRKHRWEAVPLDRLRLSLTPERHRLTVGVLLSY